jgi:hypothetical protein
VPQRPNCWPRIERTVALLGCPRSCHKVKSEDAALLCLRADRQRVGRQLCQIMLALRGERTLRLGNCRSNSSARKLEYTSLIKAIHGFGIVARSKEHKGCLCAWDVQCEAVQLRHTLRFPALNVLNAFYVGFALAVVSLVMQALIGSL